MIFNAHTESVDKDAKKDSLLKYVVINNCSQAFSYLSEALIAAIQAGLKTPVTN